ncbi:MAG: hypothetical protein KAT04_12960 [Methylococcales bacterium]|nr:hypothetical protein [Methylococcales bacterium]
MIETIKKLCTNSANKQSEYRGFYLKSDEIALSGIGVFNRDIASELKISMEKCRRELRKLEIENKLISKETAGGSTRWWVVGLAAELAL